MNRKFTAPTRPRISSGVASCTSEKRITTLTVSAAPNVASASTDSHIQCETREHDRRHTEDDDGLKHPHADAAPDGVARQTRRHQQGADRGRGAQNAEAERAGLEDIARIDRQQRRDAAEQHREQIERDRAEDRGIVADEPDPGEQIAWRCRIPDSGRLRQADRAGQDRAQQPEQRP